MTKKGIGTRLKESLEGIEESPLTTVPKEYLDKIKAHDEPKKLISYEEIQKAFSHNAKAICPEFVIDDSNRDLIHAMQMYFAQNKHFVNAKVKTVNKLSLNKGILLMGNYGFGKSILFQIFQRMYLPVLGFKEASTNEISLEYQRRGSDAIRDYVKNNWYYDDFGTEEKVSHYEQSKYIMKTVMEERYKQHQAFGWITHASTNCTPEEIGDKYGDRIYSRLYEMFKYT